MIIKFWFRKFLLQSITETQILIRNRALKLMSDILQNIEHVKQ